MTLEDKLLAGYLAVCALFYGICCYDCYVRKNWQSEDAATMGLLVVWFWPLLIVLGPWFWIWDNVPGMIWFWWRKKKDYCVIVERYDDIGWNIIGSECLVHGVDMERRYWENKYPKETICWKEKSREDDADRARA